MRKSLFKVAVCVMLLVLASASKSNLSDNKIGFQAPNIELTDGSKNLSLQHLKGKYVILSFWSSDDAQSRIANINYDRVAKANSEIDYVAVNYDYSNNVYREIVKADDLNANSQFYDNGGRDSKVFETYGLSKGLKSYLLDKSGKILAVNPTKEQVEQIVNEI